MSPPPPPPPQPLLCVDALELRADDVCDDSWLAAIADESVDDVLLRFLDDLDTLGHCAPPADAIADAFTALPASSLAPVHAEVDSATAKAKPPAPRRKRVRSATAKSSWKRQKEEIAALRSSVEALSAQRERLQQRKALHRQSEQPYGAVEHECDRDAAAIADLRLRVQHEVAAHQLATMESARLHRLAAEALQMTRSMEDAFAKHPPPSPAELLDVCPKLHTLNSDDAEAIYGQLERIVDARCRERQPFVQDAAFASGAPPRVNIGNMSSQVQFVHGTSVVANSWLTPFPAEVVNELLWRDSSMEELVVRDSVIKVVQRFKSTMFVRKHITVREPDRNERAAVFLVIKRYIDAQQQPTLAWESLAEWPGESTDASAGSGKVNFVVRGHGWGVVQPILDRGTSRSGASMFCTSTVLEPDLMADAGSAACAPQLSEAQSRMLVDAVVPTHQLGFAARVQTLENMLLDLSLTPQRT